MSRTIDERVVEMRFDNRQFEAGIDSSIESLDKLTRSLDLSGAAKGLDNIGASSKSLGEGMTDISTIVETVGSKFNAMKYVAITALANVTNSAVNAGRRMLSSLTVAPVSQGFSEYELKMGSVQTIMAGTGESLETVNKYLEELNAYSDRTIYSFSDMTNNIGKFTNAGVKLEDAVTAIKGVSNVAALSGANANEASRAMYNFSQALSAGYVKLIDWKSIENANMATVGFKDELIKTALELGTVTDAGDGMYKTLSGKTFNATKNFNDVLQEQWMTTDVLVKTLGRYTDENTELGKSAYAAAQDIKTFSMLMDTLKESAQSGWAQTWEILFGDFEEAKKLWTDVNNVIGPLISNMSNARNEMLKGWKDLGGRKALIDAFSSALQGVAAVIKPIGEAFREIFPAATGKQLFEVTERFRQLAENFKMFLTENEKGKKLLSSIKSIFKGIFAVIDIGVYLVTSIAKAFGSLLKIIAPLGGGILGFAGGLGDAIVAFRDFLKSSKIFEDVLGSIVNVLGIVIVGIKNFVTNIVKGFKKLRGSPKKDAEEFADRVETRFNPIIKLGEAIKKVFNGLGKFLKGAGGVILTIATKIGEGVGAMFKSIGESIKNVKFSDVIDIFNSGLLAAILIGIKKFLGKFIGLEGSVVDTVKDFVKGFKDILGDIRGVLGSVKDAINTFTADVKINMLKKIASAIAILTISVIALSLVNSEKLAVALGVLTGLFIDLFGSMTLFQKLMGKDGFVTMDKLTSTLIGVAAATLLLSFAVSKLAGLKPEELINGLVGITASMMALTVSAKTLSSKDVQHGAKGMMSLGISVLILAFAVEKFGKMSVESLVKGLGSVAAVLVSLVAFTKLADSNKMGAKLVALAAGIYILSMSVKNVSDLNLEQVKAGLISLAGALAIVVAASYALPKGLTKKAIDLTLLASSLITIGTAFTIFAKIPMEQVKAGLAGLAGTLAILVATLWALPKGIKKKALGISVLAAAITTLVPALAMLGAMRPEAITAALVTIAGVLTIFTIAAYALRGTEVTLLAVAGALALLGVACVTISAGVASLSVAFVTLAGAGAAGAALLTTAIKAVVAMIPEVIANIGKGVVAFLEIFSGAGETLIKVITTILKSLIASIRNVAPDLFDLVRMILNRLLDLLVEVTPRIMGWLGSLIDNLILLIGKSIPKLIGVVGQLLNQVCAFLISSAGKISATAFKMVIEFLNGIRDGIPRVIRAGADILVAIADGILSNVLYLVNTGYRIVIDFVNGVAEAIRGNTRPLVDAFGNLADALLDGLVNGLGSGINRVWQKAKELGEAAWSAIKKALGINSPSKKFMEVGEYSGEGLVIGLKNSMKDVSRAAGGVGKVATNALTDAVSKVAEIVSEDVDMTPTIRPVIDLSDVESGEKKLSKMLGGNKTISVDSATVRAASVARSMKHNEVNGGTNPTNQNGGTTFTFTQNNYSPKALSKTDIYRQTKNQISVAKAALQTH